MKKLVRIGKIIILAVAFIVVAFPFFWCLMLSFKSNAEIMSIPTTFFPSEWIVSGYKKVLTEAPFMTWLWNSLFSSCRINSYRSIYELSWGIYFW